MKPNFVSDLEVLELRPDAVSVAQATANGSIAALPERHLPRN